MRLARPAAVLTVATAAAGIAATSAPAQSLPRTARPHSRVVTYDRGEARIEALTMSVTRDDGRLRARVALSVRNDSDRTLRRELQVGPCTGGAPAAPVCPTARTTEVRLEPGEARHYAARVTLRQPPPRPDAIQAALVRRGAPQPYGYHSDGLLLLTGGAWRGAGAGRAYGVTFGPGDGARRLSFDVPLVARDRAYIDVKWEGPAAPDGAPTAISRCIGSACTSSTLPPERSRSGPGDFGNRFYLTRQGADALGLTVGAPGQASLLHATLPWPA